MSVNHSQLGLDLIRQQFPALSRLAGNQQKTAIFADAPGGTQMPQCVINGMSNYLQHGTANLDGFFPTSQETNELMQQARTAAQLFLNAPDNSVVFGANMTSLTFNISRAISRTWQENDEIVVSALDHDANISPWVIAAKERGCTIRQLDIDESCNLSIKALKNCINDNTRFVAFTLASNATGSITPAKALIKEAHEVGALVYVDAVHYAAHHLIDVQALAVDFLVCSAYKFCGPHLGLLYGKPELLNTIQPYKVRPAHNTAPNCWETGTQNFEAVAGLVACISYYAELSGVELSRQSLISSTEWIEFHENHLSQIFLDGCRTMPKIQLYGSKITESRTSTFALTIRGLSASEASKRLATQGIYTWAGHFYAVDLLQRLNLQDTGGFLRIGFVHYNTEEEVHRVLNALATL